MCGGTTASLQHYICAQGIHGLDVGRYIGLSGFCIILRLKLWSGYLAHVAEVWNCETPKVLTCDAILGLRQDRPKIGMTTCMVGGSSSIAVPGCRVKHRTTFVIIPKASWRWRANVLGFLDSSMRLGTFSTSLACLLLFPEKVSRTYHQLRFPQ